MDNGLHFPGAIADKGIAWATETSGDIIALFYRQVPLRTLQIAAWTLSNLCASKFSDDADLVCDSFSLA